MFIFRERGGGFELTPSSESREHFKQEPKPEATAMVLRQPEAAAPVKFSRESLKNIGLFKEGVAPVEAIGFPEFLPERLPGDEADVINAGEVADVGVEENFEDVDYKPSFFNRLAKNPVARWATRLLGVMGTAESMRQGVDAYQENERQAEIQQEIVSHAYESSLDIGGGDGLAFRHQIEPKQNTVDLGEGETLRGDQVLDTVNQGVTEWARESYKGLFGITDNGIAETKLADGSEAVDVLRLEWAYGDQLKSYRMDSPERMALLVAATGLDQEEFDTIGKIYRDSVIERPAASGSGLMGLQYHDTGEFNVHDAPEGHGTDETNHERLENALKITIEVVRSLDVGEMAERERSELVRVVKEAIKETIEADNSWTHAVSYTGNWDTGSFRDGFVGSVENTLEGGKGAQPMYDRLVDANEEVDLAWRKVAALEDDREGPVHAIARAVTDSLDAKAEAFFKKAVELDPQAVAFQQGLEHFSENATLVAQGEAIENNPRI